MNTAIVRIVFGAPLLAIFLAAFAVALLIEWIADLTQARAAGKSS